MAEGPNVSVRFDELDKSALIAIATRLQRSQSDVLRGLVRETWKVMQEQDMRIKPKSTTQPRTTARRAKTDRL